MIQGKYWLTIASFPRKYLFEGLLILEKIKKYSTCLCDLVVFWYYMESVICTFYWIDINPSDFIWEFWDKVTPVSPLTAGYSSNKNLFMMEHIFHGPLKKQWDIS